LPHHAVFFVLENMTVIHVKAWLIEVDADVDIFTNADKNGIFVTAFFGRG